MKSNGKAATAVRTLVSLVLAMGVLWSLQRLLMPKYMTGITEGAMVAEYYGERKDHDVIMIGDCELYENFSPAVLWREYGINSYIRGSAQQLIWQSYYFAEETFRYEKPKALVFNVLAMQYDEPQKESYNRMTLDGMKWSPSKIKSINASMTEGESFIDYLFPILRYHSRWNELTRDDFTYFFGKKTVTHNGYYMRVDTRPAKDIPGGPVLADYDFGENAYRYLDMLTALCEENGVELILVKAPSLYPYWYPEWDDQIRRYAASHNLRYYNFLENIDEIGLDFNTDTYDAGLHLNLSGAEKLTRYFGKILANDCGIKSRRGESALEKEWEDKLRRYDGDIAARRAELRA